MYWDVRKDEAKGVGRDESKESLECIQWCWDFFHMPVLSTCDAGPLVGEHFNESNRSRETEAIRDVKEKELHAANWLYKQ